MSNNREADITIRKHENLTYLVTAYTEHGKAVLMSHLRHTNPGSHLDKLIGAKLNALFEHEEMAQFLTDLPEWIEYTYV